MFARHFCLNIRVNTVTKVYSYFHIGYSGITWSVNTVTRVYSYFHIEYSGITWSACFTLLIPKRHIESLIKMLITALFSLWILQSELSCGSRECKGWRWCKSDQDNNSIPPKKGGLFCYKRWTLVNNEIFLQYF